MQTSVAANVVVLVAVGLVSVRCNEISFSSLSAAGDSVGERSEALAGSTNTSAVFVDGRTPAGGNDLVFVDGSE